MRADAGLIIAGVGRILHVEAGFAGDRVSLDSAQQLSALPGEHRPDDKLNHALECGFVELSMLQFLIQGQGSVQEEVIGVRMTQSQLIEEVVLLRCLHLLLIRRYGCHRFLRYDMKFSIT